MKIPVCTCSLVTLLLTAIPGATPLPAQDWPAPGAEVRIDAPAYRGQAVVVRAGAQELELVVPGLAQTVVVPSSSVRSLDVRVRRTGWQGARRGAILGGAIGAAVGLFGDGPAEEEGFWNSQAGVAVAMGLFGAGVGAPIGAVWPGHRWTPVSLPTSSALGLGLDPRGRLSVLVRYAPVR